MPRYRMSVKDSLDDPRPGQEPGVLKDGTLAFKNYTDCRSNRYLTPDGASRNRLNGPSQHLYLFNCPTDFDEPKMLKMLENHDLPKPTKFEMFEARGQSRTRAGTAEWHSLEEALQVMAVLNHEPIESPSEFRPFRCRDRRCLQHRGRPSF